VPALDGGWTAVIRVPATRSEESIVLDVLERERILVHPGYFFDFRREAYLVVSLIVDPDVMRSALPRALRVATT
jgi:alanine-synthesizing transaminase